jgi:hypothetical protein
MRKKRMTHGMTFFTTAEMHMEIKRVSDAQEIGMSDFVRGLIEDYLNKNTLNFKPDPKAMEVKKVRE